ncbi:MAG: AAA-like domain-containing protein [Elainella sp. Prado103]|nr:AAA-like domain-containing protein [Elainella sp. Prado103]
MTIDEALTAVEQMLLSRSLNPIERFIFQQSWLGRNYHDMAQDCSYGTTYIKEVGSQLWQDLSKSLGVKVTKKNLHLVLRQYKRHLAEDEWLKPNVATIGSSVPALQPTTPQPTTIDFPSGPLPFQSALYIERPPIETLALAEIAQPGCAIRVRAPRKMGKSSLLNRMLSYATQQGYSTVYIDFQEADESIFESLDRLLRWFCLNVSRQLEVNALLSVYWNESMGSKVSCKVYFETYLLEQAYAPILLVLNEVNRLFDHPAIADGFLSMLRFWHEQMKQEPNWRKLRIVTAQNTETYVDLLVNQAKQSPFDVGLLLTLPPFTLEQVQTLALRYQLTWAAGEVGKQALVPLYSLVGGDPHFVNLALYHLYRGSLSLEELLATATEHSGIYGQELRAQLAIVQDEPTLSASVHQLLTHEGGLRLDPRTAHRLESLGIIQLNGTLSQFSCELYRCYFHKQLLEEPGSPVLTSLTVEPIHSAFSRSPGVPEPLVS